MKKGNMYVIGIIVILVLVVGGSFFITKLFDDDNKCKGNCENKNKVDESTKSIVVAITSTGETMESMMATGLGNCSYLYIYDTKTLTGKFVESKGLTAEGHVGIVVAEQLIEEKIDVLITGSVGKISYDILKPANKKILNTEKRTIAEIVDDYKVNQTKKFQEQE